MCRTMYIRTTLPMIFHLKYLKSKEKQIKQEMSLKKTNGVGLEIDENITQG